MEAIKLQMGYCSGIKLPGYPARFAGNPAPSRAQQLEALIELAEKGDAFFPPQDQVNGAGMAEKPKRSFLRALFAPFLWDMPKMGELQLAKLLNRLQDAVQQNRLELLSHRFAKKGVGPCKILLDGNTYYFQEKPYKRPTFRYDPSPIGPFMRYTLTSEDGNNSLTLSYLDHGGYTKLDKLVYRNWSKGIKIVSKGPSLAGKARSMFASLSRWISQHSSAIIQDNTRLKHIEDLEL